MFTLDKLLNINYINKNLDAMKRVYFEKDPKRDYLFLIVSPEENAEIFRVNNFTDEMGREYVYTLVGERNEISDEKCKEIISALPNGRYKNYSDNKDYDHPRECIESIMDTFELDKSHQIYVYVRNK